MADFAVIFDLNGTLVDTEIVHANAYAQVLAPYGIPFMVQDFTEHWSRHGKKLPEYLKSIGRAEIVPDAERMLEEKQKIFQANLAAQAILMPGAREILKMLKEHNIPVGAESSGDGKNLELMLAHFDLKKFVDVVVSKDTELDEAIYGPKKQKASRLKLLADLLHYPPSHCAMLGDAEKDIKGAKEAGMTAIAVPNQYTKNHDFSLADKIVRDLTEVSYDLLASLVKK